MRINNYKFIVLSLCLLFGFKAYSQQPDTAKENGAIKQLIKNYEDAWNRHDPK